MEEEYVIYTETHENHTVERWYFGTYETRDYANDIAERLVNDWPVFHCVCKASEAEELGIKNLPNGSWR